jgi:hypothetical protein
LKGVAIEKKAPETLNVFNLKTFKAYWLAYQASQ